MKVAITGAAGIFGKGLVRVFSARHTVSALTHADFDVTQPDQVRKVLRQLATELVVHAAAVPDLDACEEDPAKAFLVNVHGTQNVLDAARDLGAGMVYISTDSVFDGKKQTRYTESDPTIPPTVYGRTKLRAEQIVQSYPASWVFRVSVLFGPGKTNFVEKGLRGIAAGAECTVAADQLGSATYTLDAAAKIMEVVEARRYGLYHLSNFGACTRLELARQAAQLAGLDTSKVIGKPVDQMGRRAVRLKYAVMSMDALEQGGFSLPRTWQEALAEYVSSLPAFR